MADTLFKKGDKVEISGKEEGFRGSWFTATVIRSPKRRGRKYVIDYDTLVTEKDETTPVREYVDLVQIRPIPPPDTDRNFRVNDEVDAFHDDGWWEGIVLEIIGEGSDSRYSVFLLRPKQHNEFDISDLRRHQEWINGNWVAHLPPFQEFLAIKIGD